MRIAVTVALLAFGAPAFADDIDARDWMKHHGVAKPDEALSNASGCTELRVGKYKELALHCLHDHPSGPPDSSLEVISDVIRVVRAHQPVVVLDVATGMVMLDAPVGAFKFFPSLRVTIARDGQSVVVDQESGESCKDLVSGSPAADDPTRDLNPTMKQVCAGLGTYRWRDDVFRRGK